MSELFDDKGRPIQVSIVTVKTVTLTKALAAAVAYSQGDVLSENASSGEDWDFAAVARANGGKGVIVKAVVRSESEAIIPRLTLHLWNFAPTNCVLNDNVASTAPNPADTGYQGFISFNAMKEWGDDSVSMATPNTPGNLPLFFECATDADDLFGVLVTEDAFTQSIGDDMTIELTIIQY